MKAPAHISSSQLTSFAECPPRWTLSYDQDRKIRSRNDAADAGVIVHGALEIWRNPENGYEPTWENLELCFKRATEELKLVESMEVYKRALDLCRRAFNLSQTHPTIPMRFAKTIGVEQVIEDYQPEGWPKPLKGFIDHLFIVTPNPEVPNEVILGVEDYKTGRPKSWSDLTDNDVQPPLYLAWAIDVLKPYVESQGYKVLRVALVWTYVSNGEAVNMYEPDFDLVLVKDYVGNLSRQIISFVDDYNKVESTLLAEIEANGNDGGDIAEFEGELDARINKFLEKYERPNSYCSYCPRKNRCTTFQRLLDQHATIDLTNPDTTMGEIWAQREKMAAIAKEGDRQKKEIDDLIRAYLDQEKLSSIEMDTFEIHADQQRREEHITAVVAEVLGNEFVLQYGSVTKDAIEKHLDLIATSDPALAEQKRLELSARIKRSPGARIVKTRKLKKATDKKPRAKKVAA